MTTDAQRWYLAVVGPYTRAHRLGEYDHDLALQAIGRRDAFHPLDVGAFLYDERNAALLDSRADREAFGHDILAGAHRIDEGWLTVFSIVPSLLANGVMPHDPTHTDQRRSA